VLILNSVVKLGKKAITDKISLLIFLAVVIASFFTDLSPVIFVLIAAVAGILVKSIGGKKA
jgi:chromate transporter